MRSLNGDSGADAAAGATGGRTGWALSGTVHGTVMNAASRNNAKSREGTPTILGSGASESKAPRRNPAGRSTMARDGATYQR